MDGVDLEKSDAQSKAYSPASWGALLVYWQVCVCVLMQCVCVCVRIQCVCTHAVCVCVCLTLLHISFSPCVWLAQGYFLSSSLNGVCVCAFTRCVCV